MSIEYNSSETPANGYTTYADGHNRIQTFVEDHNKKLSTSDYEELLSIIDNNNLATDDYIVSFLRQLVSDRIDEVYDASFVGFNNKKADELIATIIEYL